MPKLNNNHYIHRNKTIVKTALSMIAILLTAALIMTGCASQGKDVAPEEGVTTDRITQEQTTPQATTLPDPSVDHPVTTSDFSVTTAAGETVVADYSDGNAAEVTYTITASGEYYISGLLENGQIVVNVPDTEADAGTVKLILNGASITCETSAPICAMSAEKIEIEAAESTYNTITDARGEAPNEALSPVSENDALSTVSTVPTAAIYAECDLKITGEGTLIVDAGYDDGIKTKDDLTIKKVTLKVTAVGNALKGNDSVTIDSGNLILISTGADGIKTSSSDVSAKGNQRGTISINGGQIDVYAAKDGISAAYDAVIADGATINIFTASYSDYGDENTGTKEMYLIVPRSSYSNSNDYYAYFYNDSTDADGGWNGVWAKCTYETMVYSGRSASYYGLKFKLPANYQNVKFCVVKAGTTPDGSNIDGATEGEPVSTSMNAYLISSIKSGVIDGDWVMLSSGSGGSAKTTYSSKGIKAYNEVRIDGGVVTILSGDDGIHANSDSVLENGSSGAGNVTVSGGTVNITSADDGIHADNVLTISGGTVNISESYEGLEGNTVNIAGGSTFIYASDDGINACRGSSTPLVNITGGYLDVTTSSGDTDGIDSNGNITVSGGFVIVKGGSSQGNVAGSIDVDGSVKVTGGTVVALGGICETPSSGSVNTYISSGTSFSAGSYSLAASDGSVILSFSLSASYSSCWIASDGLSLNGQYKLTCGSDVVLEWTQSSTSVGSSGGWGGGPGGWGGPGGRP
ncbi:MAG: carbohydrate-binding domain-containing protein [Clostridia bacterium]|nr:carbohydrate-binding domain-containing protein [Clostridia bacterium]